MSCTPLVQALVYAVAVPGFIGGSTAWHRPFLLWLPPAAPPHSPPSEHALGPMA